MTTPENLQCFGGCQTADEWKTIIFRDERLSSDTRSTLSVGLHAAGWYEIGDPRPLQCLLAAGIDVEDATIIFEGLNHCWRGKGMTDDCPFKKVDAEKVLGSMLFADPAEQDDDNA